MIKLIGKPKGVVNLKRFHIDGVQVIGTCPSCKTKIDQGLDGDGINYPVWNEEYLYPIICDDCDCEIDVKLRFNLNIEVDGYKFRGKNE